nr:DUF488 family protein [Mycolicibacterium malmesburyense]CRL75364.1 hypothetical protein CPGR_03540 [Mycolicibacterium malmesburyense]
MGARPSVDVARVYDAPDDEDGVRVLVDRLWPRGFRKDDARVGRWLPAVAPSTELRRWYAHQPELFDEFVARYTAELETEAGAQALDELRGLLADGPVVLVTATRDVDRSNAAVLRDILTRRA